MNKEKLVNFRKEVETLINRYSIDNELNTHVFILANYLTNCLLILDSKYKTKLITI